MSAREDDRPDPDALLRRVQAEEESAERTRFRMFLGASPGVGKTYTMLENAQHLRADGVDVVVGVVETHGRKETAALLEGLEVLPLERIRYRGRTLVEFDLDAALARKPKVLLLDELAHSNAPGSRHQKRWQDASELLEAGIEVHTTLNVQHVESLNDVVAQITHVRVRETVPDAIVERADDIELVDVPVEVVLDRLKEGKVYVAEQAARAGTNFFKEGNLHALRELALRLTAERVDAEVQAWRRQEGIEATWPAGDRVMVCVGPAPASARIVRAARRMAGALHAPWLAAYVERTPARALSQDDRDRLANHLRLAESLGGDVVVLSSEKPAQALLALARERNVTRILVGKPTHPRWRDFVYGSLLDDLVRGSGDIDVHVIAGEGGPESFAPRTKTPLALDPWHAVRAALVIAAVALVGGLFRDRAAIADIAMLFLVGIAISASIADRASSLIASALAVALFDFFFVPPYGTFAVSDLRHVFTFVVMLVAGVLISGLTNRIRAQSSAARDRERRTAALYALTRALAGARDAVAIAHAATAQVREVFESRAVLLVPDREAPSGLSSPGGADFDLRDAEHTVARWAFDHAKPAGRGLDTLPGAKVIGMPLLAGGKAVGVLAVEPSPEQRFQDTGQRHLLETFALQMALALERAQLADDAQAARLRAETEELRSSLLSSVSHDLRTPIGTVLGAATTLLAAPLLPAPERVELVATIRDEAARLARLVANLLDMTRVEGGLSVRKDWVPIEELIGSALTRLEPRLDGRPVEIDLPEDSSVAVDPVLFEQVLINLLENALKYTPAGSPITVTATQSVRAVTIEIADRGPGIPPEIGPRIFEKFVRGGRGEGGAGLGLAICRGIVQAHGGTIVATARDGGGASFRVTLPVEGEPPRVPSEDETER